jgi:hypothetical protein
LRFRVHGVWGFREQGIAHREKRVGFRVQGLGVRGYVDVSALLQQHLDQLFVPTLLY